jgi:uncharacterized protein YegL
MPNGPGGESNRPGGELGKRPLQFIWLVDCSGSMQGKKIESLNFAIRECIKPMQDVADENPHAKVLVRAIKFSDSAQWHISQPTDVHDFKWNDLNAEGVTDMGHALREVAKALDVKNMPDRGLPPVLVLLSDGQPTDDFNEGLKALMDQPWGKRAVRIAIAIGDDADEDVLRKFIGNVEVPPLTAKNPQDLVRKIKWASTVPLKAASSPARRPKDQADTGHVPIPAPPPDTTAPETADDVF